MVLLAITDYWVSRCMVNGMQGRPLVVVHCWAACVPRNWAAACELPSCLEQCAPLGLACIWYIVSLGRLAFSCCSRCVGFVFSFASSETCVLDTLSTTSHEICVLLVSYPPFR